MPHIGLRCEFCSSAISAVTGNPRSETIEPLHDEDTDFRTPPAVYLNSPSLMPVPNWGPHNPNWGPHN